MPAQKTIDAHTPMCGCLFDGTHRNPAQYCLTPVAKCAETQTKQSNLNANTYTHLATRWPLVAASHSRPLFCRSAGWTPTRRFSLSAADLIPLPVVALGDPVLVVDDLLRRRDQREHVLYILLLVLVREHVAVVDLCLSNGKVRKWVVIVLVIGQVAILLLDVQPN